MSMAGEAHEALLDAKAKYEAEGYMVSLSESLPRPFDAFTADAIARRGDDVVVVEVKSANMNDWSRGRLEELTEILRAECGWRLDIVTYEREPSPSMPDLKLVDQRVREAQQLAEASPDAACLLLWSAVEGALLWEANKRQVAPTRSLPPRSLVKQLTIDGVLSDNQASELRDFAIRRDAIAHGMAANPPAAEQFDWLCRFVIAVARDQHADLHDMAEWFRANYALPEDVGVPYVSDLGRHIWDNNGPYDAEDVLRDQFEDALDADIHEAVQMLERDGTIWAQRDQP